MEIDERNIRAAYEKADNDNLKEVIKAMYPTVNFDKKTVKNLEEAFIILDIGNNIIAEYNRVFRNRFVPDGVIAFWKLKIIVAAYNKIHPEHGELIYRPSFRYDNGVFAFDRCLMSNASEIGSLPRCLYFNSSEDAGECAKKFLTEWKCFLTYEYRRKGIPEPPTKKEAEEVKKE